MAGFSLLSGRKLNKTDRQTPTVRDFYESRARKISFFRWAILLLTVLFAVYGFLMHGTELTMDNFRYMLKFLSFTEADSSTTSELFHYDYADDNQGALYKGDIVVLNGSGISVYSKDAEKVFGFSFRMDNPRLVSSGDSLYAYDLGGNEIRIFNSYSQIARIALDYPIYGFSASVSGSFAVVTAEKNYRSAVYIYDQYARQTYKRLLSDTYADYVALNDAGNAFVLLGHYSEGGYLVSFLQTYSVTQEEPTCSVKFTGEMPLKTGWLSADRFMVLTGDALRVYEAGSSEPYASLAVDTASLEGCTLSHGRILLSTAVSSLSGGSVLSVFDDLIREQLSVRFEGAIDFKTIIGDCVYVLTVGQLTKISLTDQSVVRYPVSQDAVCVLENASGEPVVFEKRKAALLSTYTPEQ